MEIPRCPECTTKMRLAREEKCYDVHTGQKTQDWSIFLCPYCGAHEQQRDETLPFSYAGDTSQGCNHTWVELHGYPDTPVLKCAYCGKIVERL